MYEFNFNFRKYKSATFRGQKYSVGIHVPASLCHEAIMAFQLTCLRNPGSVMDQVVKLADELE